MTSISSLAETASLIGDPARAAMLVALMDGRALSAGELARAAGVSPSTASGHLTRMLTAEMLALARQGRHRYYRLASPAVGAMLESMMGMTALAAAASGGHRSIRTGPREEALRQARTCYDHLAGTIAVAIADDMAKRGQLELSDDGAAVTVAGLDFLESLGVQIRGSTAWRQRPAAPLLCRPCLDWSERRPHVGGAVGAAIYQAFLANHWVLPRAGSRALSITPAGAVALRKHFGLRL